MDKNRKILLASLGIWLFLAIAITIIFRVDTILVDNYNDSNPNFLMYEDKDYVELKAYSTEAIKEYQNFKEKQYLWNRITGTTSYQRTKELEEEKHSVFDNHKGEINDMRVGKNEELIQYDSKNNLYTGQGIFDSSLKEIKGYVGSFRGLYKDYPIFDNMGELIIYEVKNNWMVKVKSFKFSYVYGLKYEIVNDSLYVFNLISIYEAPDQIYYDGISKPNYIYEITKIDLTNFKEIKRITVATSNKEIKCGENIVISNSDFLNSKYGKPVHNVFDSDLNPVGVFVTNKEFIKGNRLTNYSIDIKSDSLTVMVGNNIEVFDLINKKVIMNEKLIEDSKYDSICYYYNSYLYGFKGEEVDVFDIEYLDKTKPNLTKNEELNTESYFEETFEYNGKNYTLEAGYNGENYYYVIYEIINNGDGTSDLKKIGEYLVPSSIGSIKNDNYYGKNLNSDISCIDNRYLNVLEKNGKLHLVTLYNHSIGIEYILNIDASTQEDIFTIYSISDRYWSLYYHK